MAPRAVKGTSDERETYMAEVFRKYYADPKNSAKDLSIEKANDEFRKKYGSMLRNKKAYQIRASIKAQVLSGHRQPQEQPAPLNRSPDSVSSVVQDLVDPSSGAQAVIIEGTPGQLQWLQTVLGTLGRAGLAQARVDHCTDNYCVVART